MKKTIAILSLTALLIPGMALAGTTGKKATPKKSAGAAWYVCAKCHMKYSAAEAKKDHYIDPMDGGKLVAVKSSPKTSAKKAM